MVTGMVYRASCMTTRRLSTIPVKQVASVLKLNVGNEVTATQLDGKMKTMTEMMREHEGFESATRYVCKSEWAYELSFIFDTPESFGAWKTSTTRDKVHAFYLESIKECGIKEDDVCNELEARSSTFLCH